MNSDVATTTAPEQRWDPGDPLDTAFVDDEVRIREELRRGDFTRWRQPGGHVLHEELTGLPERLFLFEADGRWYAGCKTISDYVLDKGMPGVFCSRVYWYNVVGTVESVRTSVTDARIVFRPLDEAGRRAAFEAVTPLTEIVHPFAKQREPGREKTSPADGWLVTEERAAFLGLGEEHIRRYTRERFGPWLETAAEEVLAYDPACSTGQFLSEFAAADPARIRTVGQDLSRQMTEFAASRLDRVAAATPCAPRSRRAAWTSCSAGSSTPRSSPPPGPGDPAGAGRHAAPGRHHGPARAQPRPARRPGPGGRRTARAADGRPPGRLPLPVLRVRVRRLT
ncbi:hypothetical protein GQS52_16065 [Streptomyces sp. SCUT-3]|uniref:hypothetical protein n=1 Tax=Streptomyces sp. SCUT-3 TaxID=2684469 RepID=UPI0015FE0052|nr:hypothetical protein [Streptomyces sp. SCUT-3]QMV23040.1 hypothetical protein GQS52_16065 [Streptomyces sp. SCUT-3]